MNASGAMPGRSTSRARNSRSPAAIGASVQGMSSNVSIATAAPGHEVRVRGEVRQHDPGHRHGQARAGRRTSHADFERSSSTNWCSRNDRASGRAAETRSATGPSCRRRGRDPRAAAAARRRCRRGVPPGRPRRRPTGPGSPAPGRRCSPCRRRRRGHRPPRGAAACRVGRVGPAQFLEGLRVVGRDRVDQGDERLEVGRGDRFADGDGHAPRASRNGTAMSAATASTRRPGGAASRG